MTLSLASACNKFPTELWAARVLSSSYPVRSIRAFDVAVPSCNTIFANAWTGENEMEASV